MPSYIFFIMCSLSFKYPSRCSRGLRGGSTPARLLGLGIRIPPRSWMSVSCTCCQVSATGRSCLQGSPNEKPHRGSLDPLGLSSNEKKSLSNPSLLSLTKCPNSNLYPPASCKMGTRSFLGVKCGRGVLLTTHPSLILVPLSWKSRAIPLPTLSATPGL